MSPGPPKSATTGTEPVPRASKTMPAPLSRTDGNTSTSADLKRLRTSAWLIQPQKETAFSIPRDLVSCSRRSRSGPSPTTVNRAKSLRKRGAAARNARSQALRGTRPPTKIRSNLAPGSGLRESPKHSERAMPGSGIKNSLSRYAANSAYVWDEAAMIAAA